MKLWWVLINVSYLVGLDPRPPHLTDVWRSHPNAALPVPWGLVSRVTAEKLPLSLYAGGYYYYLDEDGKEEYHRTFNLNRCTYYTYEPRVSIVYIQRISPPDSRKNIMIVEGGKWENLIEIDYSRRWLAMIEWSPLLIIKCWHTSIYPNGKNITISSDCCVLLSRDLTSVVRYDYDTNRTAPKTIRLFLIWLSVFGLLSFVLVMCVRTVGCAHISLSGASD